MPEQPAISDDGSNQAFRQTQADLRNVLHDAPVDRESFQRRIERCDLARCHGMCCYDGIYLAEEEAEVLSDLAHDKTDFFSGLGLELPDTVVVQGEWKDILSGPKTAVREHDFQHLVDGYPKHFKDTACVFMVADGRCSLQVLSESEGKHPWFYKPTGCWLHPISTRLEDRPEILLEDEDTDPDRFDDYDGYVTQTFCGRTVSQGTPACEVLAPELDFLGAILGRSLRAEVS